MSHPKGSEVFCQLFASFYFIENGAGGIWIIKNLFLGVIYQSYGITFNKCHCNDMSFVVVGIVHGLRVFIHVCTNHFCVDGIKSSAVSVKRAAEFRNNMHPIYYSVEMIKPVGSNQGVAVFDGRDGIGRRNRVDRGNGVGRGGRDWIFFARCKREGQYGHDRE